MSTKNKLDLSETPFEKNLDKKKEWELTIETLDKLAEHGYNPIDFSQGCVKMGFHGFKKLAAENGGLVSTKETSTYRISALWVGPIEINFTEVKDQQSEWSLVKGWIPL